MGEGQQLEPEELENRPLPLCTLVLAPYPQVLFVLGTGVMRVLRVHRPFVKCPYPSLQHQARPMGKISSDDCLSYTHPCPLPLA